MGIEEKIGKSGINKILVVDDSLTNLTTVMNCLEKLPVDYDATGNASDAIKKIRDAYDQRNKYDLVLSDLSMETDTAGLDVVREGLKHQTYSVIITERISSGNHGSATSIEPNIGEIQNRKSDCWPEIFETVIDNINGKGRFLYNSLNKLYENIGIPEDNIANENMIFYEHLK
ncbi:MAG: response regulator [Nanobdellota archaeon]